MKQIVLSIEDRKYNFFMELIKSFSFIKIEKKNKLNASQIAYVNGLKEALEEVELHEKGKTKSKLVKDFLNEL